MTCLVFPPIAQPDDQGDGSSANGLVLAMIRAGLEQLRTQWDAHGFDGAIFRSGSDLQARLEPLQPRQRRKLLTTIVGLCDEPDQWAELQRLLASGLIEPGVGRLQRRVLAALEPVLTLPPGPGLRSAASHQNQACPLERPVAQESELALLGLSMRSYNALRRQGLSSIRDLAGLQDWQLLNLRNFGTRGLQEVRDGLERLGLAFPLPLDQAEGFTPPAHLRPGPEATGGHSATRPGGRSLPLPIDPAEDQRWLERATALIGTAVAEGQRPLRALDELASLTLEHFNALDHRSLELNQLLTVFHGIAVAGLGDDHRQLLAEGLQAVLLEAYRQRCATADGARRWLQQLLRAVEPARAVPAYLRHAAGESLRAIGDSAYPPISRDVVRTSFSPLSTCAACSPKQLAKQLESRLEALERQQLRAALEPWLQSLGRLPFHTDDLEEIACTEGVVLPAVAEPVLELSLNQRLHLYEALSLEIPEAEWDLHLRVIVNNEAQGGPGYWQRQPALRVFLHRFAVLLGAPGLMPKQTQLPPAVSGAVQRHGGQSAVARAVGLTYQGQLVGENGGRTYWTEERLSDLLAQTVRYHGLAADTLPNRSQIQAFLASGVVPDYRDKQPNSVIAAMSRQGTLSWEQIAERFGRIWRG